MQTQLSQQPLEQIEAAALVVVAFEKEVGEPVRAPAVAGGWIADLYAIR